VREEDENKALLMLLIAEAMRCFLKVSWRLNSAFHSGAVEILGVLFAGKDDEVLMQQSDTEDQKTLRTQVKIW